jgi:hypothetical protein
MSNTLVIRDNIPDTGKVYFQGEKVPLNLFPPRCCGCNGTGRFGGISCYRCNGEKRLNATNMARYWAWHTKGYNECDMTLQFIKPGMPETSARDFKYDTLVYTFHKNEWKPLKAENVFVDDWILVPSRQANIMMVVKITAIMKK